MSLKNELVVSFAPLVNAIAYSPGLVNVDRSILLDQIDDAMAFGLRNFKRRDLLFYFIGQFKYEQYRYCHKYLGDNLIQFDQKMGKFARRFEQRFRVPTEGRNWLSSDPGDHFRHDEARQKLKHFYDLIPLIKELRDFQFFNTGMLSVDLFKHFQDIELAQRSLECLYVTEHGSKLLEVDEESAWFDLDNSSCRQEAKAMGHCGNGRGNGQHQHTLLSYRRRHPEKAELWRPELTFVLDTETGELGEMKGRYNSKPTEKYHNAVLKLLLNEPRITAIKGGGYQPQNNFDIDDLSPLHREKLAQIKPQLLIKPEQANNPYETVRDIVHN